MKTTVRDVLESIEEIAGFIDRVLSSFLIIIWVVMFSVLASIQFVIDSITKDEED